MLVHGLQQVLLHCDLPAYHAKLELFQPVQHQHPFLLVSPARMDRGPAMQQHLVLHVPLVPCQQLEEQHHPALVFLAP